MNIKRATCAILSGLVGMMIAYSPEAEAWRPLGNTWGKSRATMSLVLNVNDPLDQAGEVDVWNILAENALATWNNSAADGFQVPGSRFMFFFNNKDQNACDRFSVFGTSNAVEWASDRRCSGVFGPYDLAITFKTDNPVTGRVNNADVLFRRDLAGGWTSADPGFTLAGPIDFNSVAIHEFGHVLGLEHEDRTLAVMNSIYHPNSGRLHADDRRGIRSRYVGRGTETDIGPSNWTKKTAAKDVAAALVVSPASATAGNTITMEWTQENFGTTFASFNIGFFLSTDNSVSPSQDALLGRNLGASVRAGFSGTHSRDVTIPAVTLRGAYFLGVCLDDDNALAERFEENNCLAHPRTINISAAPGAPIADLEVAKTDSPDPVGFGASLTYTVTVTNNGPAAAQSVTLTDNLSPSVRFDSTNPSQGTCTGGTDGSRVICQFGGLAPGTSATVTIDVVAGLANPTNTVNVTGAVNDPDPSNNTATERTTLFIP